VLNLAVHGPGATISAGQVVLEIVPENQPLVVKARIEPNDIEQVAPGQSVELHILAYNQRYQSILRGTLKSVSADRLEDPVTHAYYYTGIVGLDPADLAAAKVALMPGMNATAMIITGKRTVMDYFLDPVYHVYDFAMKED
jgi:HlyD family secretion protein